jgi:hypothetical protein
MGSLSFDLEEDSRTPKGERVYRDASSTLMLPRTYLFGRTVSSSVDGTSSMWVRTTFRAKDADGEVLKQPVVLNTSLRFSNRTDLAYVTATSGPIGAYTAHMAVLGCDEFVAAVPDMGFAFPIGGHSAP